MLELERHVADARDHLRQAEHWDWSPDPWAEAIAYLADKLFEATAELDRVDEMMQELPI